jgi:hypothetical protein
MDVMTQTGGIIQESERKRVPKAYQPHVTHGGAKPRAYLDQ